MQSRHKRVPRRSTVMPDTLPALIWRLAERGGVVCLRGALIMLLLVGLLAVLATIGDQLVAALVSLWRLPIKAEITVIYAKSLNLTRTGRKDKVACH
jgi:hypothetical protein